LATISIVSRRSDLRIATSAKRVSWPLDAYTGHGRAVAASPRDQRIVVRNGGRADACGSREFG
jgi:hypothetical protein